jgi:hypothetical protein
MLAVLQQFILPPEPSPPQVSQGTLAEAPQGTFSRELEPQSSGKYGTHSTQNTW